MRIEQLLIESIYANTLGICPTTSGRRLFVLGQDEIIHCHREPSSSLEAVTYVAVFCTSGLAFPMAMLTPFCSTR
jgi:hypothetical protein